MPIDSILHGFSVVFEPSNLIFVLIGAMVGTIIGAMPGLGPSATIAILLPLTIGLDPTTALIMFAGIYTGAMYGGSLTSVLVNTPGESSTVMTALDGYKLARQGRGGAALGMAAISSFVAGTIAVVLLMFTAHLMSSVGLALGPPEYFALILFSLVLLGFIGQGSAKKSAISALAGLLVATVGADPIAGKSRFTFGFPELIHGIDFIIVVMGLFAVAEIMVNLEGGLGKLQAQKLRWREMYPKRQDITDTWPSMLRGGGLGFFVGTLPGAGATVASLATYGLDRRVSRHRKNFGKGAMAGVVAPEAGNNAASAGALVPLLTLGIPGSGSTAVMLGALIVYGIEPGPLLIQNEPTLVWGVIASLYLSNIVLMVLNLPLAPAFASVLRAPYRYLYPVILVVTVVGVFSLRESIFDVGLLLLFGLVGYGMRKTGFPAAPFALTVVLGPLLERSLNQSLTISQGDLSIFVTRPISLGLVAAIGAVLVAFGAAAGISAVRRRRAAPDAAGQTAEDVSSTSAEPVASGPPSSSDGHGGRDR